MAEQTGISQSTLAGYFCGRYDIGNMTVTTLLKIFPSLRLTPDQTNNFQGAHLTGVQLGNANRMEHVNIRPISDQSDFMADDSTRILLNYWRDLSQSKRFEFLARLAEIKEQ